MTTHSQRALILYRRRRFINHLLTYLLNTLRSLKQQIWLRTALCGKWCRHMALCNLRVACQKRRRQHFLFGKELDRLSWSFSLYLSENKHKSNKSSLSNLMKVDIDDDLEWPLKIILGTINSFIVYVKNTAYMSITSQWQQTMMLCEKLFLLSCTTSMTVLWCWVQPVGNSCVSCWKMFNSLMYIKSI